MFDGIDVDTIALTATHMSDLDLERAWVYALAGYYDLAEERMRPYLRRAVVAPKKPKGSPWRTQGAFARKATR